MNGGEDGGSHHTNLESVGRRNTKPQARTALILYGSETGNAQDVAEEISRMAERLRFDTTVLDLDSIQLRDLLKYSMVIFAVSTAGQGEMPQNARSFWKTLLSGALKPGVLKRLRFTTFGIGDSSYLRYNVAHRMLCGRMAQLGASLFCDRGEGNEQHPEGHSAGFREWLVQLREAVLSAFPFPKPLEPLADDDFILPKWTLAARSTVQDASLEISAHVRGTGHLSNGYVEDSVDQGHPAGLDKKDAVPSKCMFPVRDSYSAFIDSNKRMTSSTHFQDVCLLDLRLDRKYTYGPGAVAVVYPKNFPTDVNDFIDLMQWQSCAEQALDVVSSGETTKGVGTPSPLRHLDLADTRMTLRWLLENVLDIMSIPRRSFFANLAYFAGTSTEDEVYQRDRLLELANPELIDELWDYTTRPKRTILEVMMDFTTFKIPWQYALSVLPIMRGRQFSIASGGRHTQDEDGRTRVQLLVAIADPPSPIIKYRRRYGICTRYIAILGAGQHINIGMQQGYLDVQRNELEIPVIMIGPGTGVAPMRSMIHQRRAWKGELDLKHAGNRLDGDMLFFGCRSSDADDFFREEWEQLIREEGLQVYTAYSRDKTQPKQYVQDLLRANAAQVYNTLVERSGKVYLSGSSGAMPKGVREALLDVIEQEGKMTRTDAEVYLDGMEKEGRYKQETW
ncbi:NAPDH-dependent diflavin reductase [Oleoguttula sp. CCFEE 5521]